MGQPSKAQQAVIERADSLAQDAHARAYAWAREERRAWADKSAPFEPLALVAMVRWRDVGTVTAGARAGMLDTSNDVGLRLWHAKRIREDHARGMRCTKAMPAIASATSDVSTPC